MQVSDFLRRTAALFPDNIAAVFYDDKISYRDLDNRSNRLADYLKSLNLPGNSRIGLFMENSIDYMISYFAVIKAGFVIIPIDTSSNSEKLKYLLNDSNISTLLIHFRYQRTLASIYKENHPLKLIISEKDLKLKDDKLEYISFNSIFEEFESGSNTESNKELVNWDDLDSFSNELAAVFYTSGSTGEPKGVMLSHRNLMSNTIGTTEYLKLTEKDSVMVVLPFYYIYGNSLLLTHVAVGGCLVIDNRFMYAETVLDGMIEHKVTGFSGVPSNFMILLQKSTLTERSFPDLRYFTQAGGAMAPEITRQLMEAFPDKEIYIMYGQTEASPRVTWLPPERLKEKLGSIGVEVRGLEVDLIKENGEEAKIGEVGEIVVGGDSVMLGYWNQPDEEALVLKDRKLYTGDLAKRDEDGYIYIVGRKKEIIKSGGNRISVKEIEETLIKHDDILEIAVFGVPDDVFGEAVKAVIVLKENSQLDEKSLKQYSRSQMAEFKVPRYIQFIDELPKTQAGKIDKKALKRNN